MEHEDLIGTARYAPARLKMFHEYYSHRDYPKPQERSLSDLEKNDK